MGLTSCTGVLKLRNRPLDGYTIGRRRERTHRVLKPSVDPPPHQTPHQRLKGDDLVRGRAQRVAERQEKRDVAGVDCEMRDIQHLWTTTISFLL